MARQVISTNVRSNKAPWLLRAGLGAVKALAPPLAARLGERLFLTPPRHAAPPQEREALARAVPMNVPFRRGWLRAWRFGEGPAVLLVHGWGGRGGQMAAFAPALVEAGCSAVTFDGPGHGASSGRVASVPLFAEAVAAMADRFGARAAIAHSMGAGGTGLALAADLELEAAVFVGPPRGPGAFFRQFCEALGIGPDLRDSILRRLERQLGMPLADFDVQRTARAQTAPLLVIHDRGDVEVPWSDGAAIARAWPGAQLETTEGLGHRRILRDPWVLARAAEFAVEHLGRCSCGRPASGEGWAPGLCARCSLDQELFDPSSRLARAG
jgi:pimeloyl-ACP methyl ester carboxylesterase